MLKYTRVGGGAADGQPIMINKQMIMTVAKINASESTDAGVPPEADAATAAQTGRATSKSAAAAVGTKVKEPSAADRKAATERQRTTDKIENNTEITLVSGLTVQVRELFDDVMDDVGAGK